MIDELLRAIIREEIAPLLKAINSKMKEKDVEHKARRRGSASSSGARPSGRLRTGFINDSQQGCGGYRIGKEAYDKNRTV